MLTAYLTTATRQPQPHNGATSHRSLHDSILLFTSGHQLLDHLHRLVPFAGFGDRASIFHGRILSRLFLISRGLDDYVTPSTVEGGSSAGEEAAMVNFCAGVDL